MAVIELALNLLTESSLAIRACAAVMGVIEDLVPAARSTPAPNTVQSWFLRIGLAELLRPKEEGDDWVLLLDHTSQLGNQKCLAVLGIRLEHWGQLKRPLKFEDMTIIDIDVVERSTGEVVSEQLQRIDAKLSGIAAILSDQGSDLVRGLGLWLENRQDTPAKTTALLRDFSHLSSHVLKRLLESQSRWKEFLAACGKTQPKIKQTPLGALAPPTQKVKGRYMNIGEIIRWAIKMLETLRQSDRKLPASLSYTQIHEKFGWLQAYEEDMAQWRLLDQIREDSLEHLRRSGYHEYAATEVSELLDKHRRCTTSRQMVRELYEAVERESVGLASGASAPATTEIIESLFGKLKHSQGQHSRGGFSKMILNLAALTVSPTRETIQTSLESTSEASMRQWVFSKIGTTMRSLRDTILVKQIAHPK